ncbi:hypothetical protein DM01DRAFT_1379940 [Hesseltinella vesiculosa]|uniref:SWI/SNF and RSC complexes subunit Ssr4 C-terminal domain-containing protein n=1 Tax=Hesseltinella vesiculosa TaxID=101127 RepID=A0A1X2GVN7_9FUNG|nr:hypothetical protein DM01DRAFT_1379940 [Hesseltinella vesiculosa]
MDSIYYYRQGQPPPQQQQQQQPRPMAHAPYPANYRPAPPASQKRHKPSHHTPPAHEDRDEPSGDELDDISARDIAMARYKRNHDYLSEIFTPYNADHIVPPPFDITQTKDELQKLMDDQHQAIKQQEQEHKEKMDKFIHERDLYWSNLTKLNDATSLEDMDQQAQAIASMMNAKVETVTERAQAHQIPGLKDEPLPSPPPPAPAAPANHSTPDVAMHIDQPSQDSSHHHHQQDPASFQQHIHHHTPTSDLPPTSVAQDDKHHDVDMYTNFDQAHTDKSNDDFFNEMLNTNDDDPSVSEFMDFEQEKTDEQ